MVLDHIILVLQSMKVGHKRAVELGRLGFMEWLASLPANSDIAREARFARRKLDILGPLSPATGELKNMLVLCTRPTLVSRPARRARKGPGRR